MKSTLRVVFTLLALALGMMAQTALPTLSMQDAKACACCDQNATTCDCCQQSNASAGACCDCNCCNSGDCSMS